MTLEPIPTYKRIIDVGSIDVDEKRLDSNPKIFNLALRSLKDYLESNTFNFHNSRESYTNKGYFYLTPNNIVISLISCFTNEEDRKPINSQLWLYSFSTPVDGLAKKLVEVAKSGL